MHPQDVLQSVGQKLAMAGAAAVLSLGAMSGAATANEFDIIGEAAPTTNYFVDDANVLSKSTRGDLNKRLTTLEVWSSSTGGGWRGLMRRGGARVCRLQAGRPAAQQQEQGGAAPALNLRSAQ